MTFAAMDRLNGNGQPRATNGVGRSIGRHAPLHICAGTHRHYPILAERQLLWYAALAPHQAQAPSVAGQPVELRPKVARETFQARERACRVEGFGIERHGAVRGVDSRAAAIALLRMPRMWRAVRAKEELGIA